MSLLSDPKRRAQVVARLRERDGDGCWICEMVIDFSLAGSEDPMMPTIDHVIPRGRGGKNVMSNFRLAHKKCNGRRGSREPPWWMVVHGSEVREVQAGADFTIEWKDGDIVIVWPDAV